MSAEHYDRPIEGVTVRPQVLLDDRFSSDGDMVSVLFNPVSETILLHIATEGCGTVTGRLDETSALLIATALLRGVCRVEPDDFRVRAAYALLAEHPTEDPEEF